jgi:hypothetical protein
MIKPETGNQVRNWARRGLMALEDALRGLREASAKRMPAARAAVMDRATEELRASGIMDGVIKIGDRLPSFALPNAYRREVLSADLLAQGPLVLTVFRGAGDPTATQSCMLCSK